MKTAKRAATSDLASQRLATWDQRWRNEFEQRTQAMLAEDLASLDDAGMLDHLGRATALLDDGHHVHFQLYMPYTLALYDLVVTCRELLGWDEHHTMRLLVGCSPASVAGTRALEAISDRVAQLPELADALRATPAAPVAALHTVAPDLADQLDPGSTHTGGARPTTTPDRPRSSNDPVWSHACSSTTRHRPTTRSPPGPKRRHANSSPQLTRPDSPPRSDTPGASTPSARRTWR
jgi:hypothetical protein